ncbi:MAG: MFS transporter [Eubacterium sp.]|jgi:OFA family oxalate/formate antiporter-like MFS transporter|nr:MFS transporter [Eubacterium sp.]
MNQNKKLSQSLTDSRFGSWGWSMIIYAMLMYFFFAALSTDGQNLFPGAFAGAYGFDPNALLAYATPASIVGIVGGFLFARLLIKHSTRMISVISLIITGVAFCLWGMCANIVLYVLLLMVVCFFASSFSFVAPTLMTDWFPRKKGIALGWATIGAPLSSAFFVSGFSVLLAKAGFKAAFIIFGIAVIIIGIISLFWVKDTPETVGHYPDNMAPAAADKFAQDAGQALPEDESSISLGTILKTPNTWLISIGYGLLWMVTVGVVSQFIPRMMSVGYTQPEALTFLTISSIIAIPGSYFWGWLDGKIGTKPASVIYSISYIVALLILIFASNPVLIWIGCIFIGLGLGGILNLIPSMVMSIFGKSGFKQANSIVTTIASLIRVLAFAIMATCLAISGGSYTLPYTVFIIMDILGAVVLMLIRNKKKQ